MRPSPAAAAAETAAAGSSPKPSCTASWNRSRAATAATAAAAVGGGSGEPDAYPQAVFTGEKCQIRAIIYAPNGTVHIGAESEVVGSLIAKDVLVEKEATVAIGSSF